MSDHKPGVPTPTVKLDTSKFHRVSVGRAAENLKPGSKLLEVWPTELLPYVSGEIDATKSDLTHQGVDAQGNNYSVTVTTSLCIEAIWYPNHPGNQVTPPNVRRGTRVQLWKYADHDEYYWTDMGLDPDLRKLETVTHLFSANQDEDTKNDQTNSYQVEVSTHKGHIIIQTTTANGEPLPLTMMLDTKNGTFQVCDNKSTPNALTMDFVNDIFNVQNAQGCVWNAAGENMTLTVPDTYTVNTKNYVVNTTNYTITATAAMTLKAATYALTATGTAIITAATLTVDAITNFAKAVTMAMTLGVAGALKQNGVDVGALHTHTTTTSGEQTSTVNN